MNNIYTKLAYKIKYVHELKKLKYWYIKYKYILHEWVCGGRR